MKYRVRLREVCEPVSQKEWDEYFDTIDEAKRRIIAVNAGKVFMNTPDWYMEAKHEIEEVE